MLLPLLFYVYNVTVVVNGSVILECDGDNIRWVHYPHIPVVEQVIYENDSKVGWFYPDDRYSVVNSSLRIDNIRKTNGGHYLCNENGNILKFYNVIVSDDNSTDNEYRFRFHRYYSPEQVTVFNLRVIEGDDVELHCNSTSRGLNKLDYLTVRYYPTIKPENNYNVDSLLLYTEFFNDFYYSDVNKMTLMQYDSHYSVKIKNFSTCDIGYYECAVSNVDSTIALYYIGMEKSEKNWWRKTSHELMDARRVREHYMMVYRKRAGI